MGDQGRLPGRVPRLPAAADRRPADRRRHVQRRQLPQRRLPISANDYNKTHDWWSGQVVQPGNDAFRLNMAFNGEGGSDPDNPNDPLTKAVTATAYDFYFTSHTFTHE